MSARGREALADADVVLCEDTRTTRKLLSALGIEAKLQALHEHNEDAAIPGVLARLRAGARVALVSDAGTPLMSDPGFRLLRAAINEGLPVTGVPGANAAVMAVTLSGLPPLPSLMLGFPPPRAGARRASFARLRAAERAGLSATLVWHEAPHRLAETLHDLAEVFGDRPAAVARELTKRFEEVRRGGLPKLAEHYGSEVARGEVTVVIAPAPGDKAGDEIALDEALRAALRENSVRDAAVLVARATGLPRKQVYARALAMNER